MESIMSFLFMVTQLVKKKDSKSKLCDPQSLAPAHVAPLLSLYGVLNNHPYLHSVFERYVHSQLIKSNWDRHST